MDQHAIYLAKAEETASLAAKAHDPIVQQTLREMEEIYRLLAQLAASRPDKAEPLHQERQNAPFYGTLIDGSDHRH
jgi:hypothetical protein